MKKLINDVYINLKKIWVCWIFYLAIIVIIITTNSEGFDVIIVMSLCIILISILPIIYQTQNYITYYNENEIVQKRWIKFRKCLKLKKIKINEINIILFFPNLIIVSDKDETSFKEIIKILNEKNYTIKLQRILKHEICFDIYRDQRILRILQKTNARKILITNQRRGIQLFNKYFTN